jgi:cAMP phosphodiesterase
MKIKILGCSGAKFPGHNVPGFLLDDEILFDAGSLTGVLDVKAQIKIKNIFVTHAHLDHVRGIPSLADNIVVGNLHHRVNIISIPHVIKTIKRHLLNNDMWPDFTIIPQPDDGVLKLVELKAGKSMKIKNYIIIPYKVNHTVPAVGFLVEDKKNTKRFFYTGDIGPSDYTWEKIGNTQIHCLIIDVSFPNSMEEMAIKTGHLTPNLLREELLKIRPQPEKIFITHIKPQFLKIVKTELKKLRMKNLKILNDGDIIRI